MEAQQLCLLHREGLLGSEFRGFLGVLHAVFPRFRATLGACSKVGVVDYEQKLAGLHFVAQVRLLAASAGPESEV